MIKYFAVDRKVIKVEDTGVYPVPLNVVRHCETIEEAKKEAEKLNKSEAKE